MQFEKKKFTISRQMRSSRRRP